MPKPRARGPQGRQPERDMNDDLDRLLSDVAADLIGGAKKPGAKFGRSIRRDQKSGKLVVGDTIKWPIQETPLERIHLPIVEKVKQRINEGVANLKVVEWGCGLGVAIGELKKKFPKAECVGYSGDIFREWGAVKGVEFVHMPAENLPRHFEDESIDVLYSHKALRYLERHNPKKYGGMVDSLIKKLKHGGFMLIDGMGDDEFKRLRRRRDLEVTEDLPTLAEMRTHMSVVIRRKLV